MRWKTRAIMQNVVALLPSAVSYDAYYWMQRHFGGLRRVNPLGRLAAGIEIGKRILKQHRSLSGKVFLEVGTGRVPLVPLAYWLMGAKQTVTIDANPYLKEELIVEHLHSISENEEEILKLFGSLLDRTRFDELLLFARKRRSAAAEFLDLCQINYIAPGNAADTTLPEQSIDFHTSFTVFEHIPPDVLFNMLREADRITKSDGLFVHRIDYSDHFSHSDKSITSINFLQYSDDEWAHYANNRYMYMNRLRHDDFLALFTSVGQKIVDVQPDTDPRSEKLLRAGGLPLDRKFSSKPKEVLAIKGAWIVTEKNS